MMMILGSTAAVFGLLTGSFLNVCIYRLPRGESIVSPRSHCPHCKHLIGWYDNIPVLSYLFLRGKCRHCSESISLRYPVVEILSALLSVAIVIRFGSAMHYVAYFLLLSAPLIVITFIDLKHLLIPDALTLPGIVAGVFVHVYLGNGSIGFLILDAVSGLVLGGGILYLLGFSYEKIRGRVGLGLGDVKLAAMIGAFFGWQAIIFILLLASVIGTLMGLMYLLFHKKGLQEAVPFGPFLAMGAWLYLFFGANLIDQYLSLTRTLFNWF